MNVTPGIFLHPAKITRSAIYFTYHLIILYLCGMIIEDALPILLETCQKAGDAILEVYQKEDFSAITDKKADNSPLTLADRNSHEIIARYLKQYFPEIPVISEEGKDIPFAQRKYWNRFWLVDPLDGTKEFLKRNGQFTVNIALIEDHYPVLGIIYAPVAADFWYGSPAGAFKKENRKPAYAIKVNQRKNNLITVRSASHASPEEDQLFAKFDVSGNISIGSSLKFCMVAEGKADIYYRHGPTMEWDTAAGQAILEAAGGQMLHNQGPARFSYNKESLLNSSFLCLGF
jgi:3'(2'), 5'-bisphosphate nucleotidase